MKLLEANDPQLPNDLVIVRVAANPDPCDGFVLQTTERAIMVADSNRETVLTSLQPSEVKGRVIGIRTPEIIRLDGQLLNFSR
jgi:hypothetical protein